jgi:hypothetical protein
LFFISSNNGLVIPSSSLIIYRKLMSYPEKADGIMLVASSCGGKDAILPPSQLMQLQRRKLQIPEVIIKPLLSASLGSG